MHATATLREQNGTKRSWHCETKHSKELPVCCSMKPKMCLLQLCSFFIGGFGLRFMLWDQFSNNGPCPPLICSSAWGTNMLKSDRACVLDLSSKSLWSSLVSCEDTSQARNQSMAACSNQNMTKYNIDANPPFPPCTSSRALKRETSEVDFRCSWHKPLLQEDYSYNHIITCN